MSKDSIIDGIVEAQQRLLKENIRANCVIVDRKYIQLRKRLYMTVCGNVVMIPPMIGGLRVEFDDLPEDAAFMVFEGNPPTTEWDRMKAENDDMREKLMKIKEVLGADV
jgi:hypothetical protein